MDGLDLYCSGGIKSFLAIESGGKFLVYPCFDAIHRCSPLFELGEKFKQRNNAPCRCSSNIHDERHVIKSSNKNDILRNDHARIVLFLTTRCLNDCPYCMFSEGRDMPLEPMLKLCHDAKNALPGHRFNVVIIGGEPALHPKYPEIISCVRNILEPDWMNVCTSLTVPSAEIDAAEALGANKQRIVWEICIHPTGKLFRPAKFFETLGALLDRKITVSITMVEHPLNDPFIPGFREICERSNLPFRVIPEYKEHPDRPSSLDRFLRRPKPSLSKKWTKI